MSAAVPLAATAVWGTGYAATRATSATGYVGVPPHSGSGASTGMDTSVDVFAEDFGGGGGASGSSGEMGREGPHDCSTWGGGGWSGPHPTDASAGGEGGATVCVVAAAAATPSHCVATVDT